VAGADVVRDAVTFFQAFEGMEEGFRTRAIRVNELLKQPGTAFVLVASPRPDSVDEAVHFAAKLADADMSVTALIVNRVQPRFIDDPRLGRLAELAGRATGDTAPLRVLVDNLAGYAAASDRDEQVYGDLVARVAPAPVSRVPLLNTDVHDLNGLRLIADLLFVTDGRAAVPPPAPTEAPQKAG
jgi:anion-transporting  ArsA/GET3 family ATPase